MKGRNEMQSSEKANKYAFYCTRRVPNTSSDKSAKGNVFQRQEGPLLESSFPVTNSKKDQLISAATMVQKLRGMAQGALMIVINTWNHTQKQGRNLCRSLRWDWEYHISKEFSSCLGSASGGCSRALGLVAECWMLNTF